MAIKLEYIMNRIDTLPALPTSALRVLQMTKNPETTVKELHNAIALDPSLAASILRQANSAYYGYARRISTLTDAIIILGFQTIQGLAMAAAVSPMLKKQVLGYNIDQEGLWQHSMLTAMMAMRLSKRLKKPFADTAFTVGLLHDIGKLVLSVYVQEVGHFMLESIEEQQISYSELEEKVIGFDHAVVGGFICQRWNLPEEIAEPVTFHHKPGESKNFREMTSVVHIANCLAQSLGLGDSADSFLNPLDPDTLELFGLSETDLDSLIAETSELISDPHVFS
ncbi:MAG: HDOD domain-containing protein [Peptococcaceae bacterium]|jgi:putative nucleotidyltransferase with HDIG domain|nr:HDOD domain-containing protein [Peptococcaceae bacterium]